MTADARQQAERAVDAVLHEDRRDGATGDFAVRRRAIDALAAAIELVEDAHSGEPASWEVVQERYRKMDALLEALSALGVEVDGVRPHSGDSAKEDGDE